MRKIFLYIFFSSMISFAYSQIRQGPPQPGIEVRLFNTMKTLSEEQKNQITSELDNIKRSRELFRGTLSKKQLDILLVPLLDFNQNQQNNIFKRNLMIGQSMVLKGILCQEDLGIHTMKTLVNIQLK